MKIYYAIIGLALLVGCGGSSEVSRSDNEEPTPNVDLEEPNLDASATVGYYPAEDGSGYSEFHDLIMPENGYLDITAYKSSVSLHYENLEVLDENLTSNDFIMAGNYKVKISYDPTSLLPGNVTVFSLSLTSYDTLPDLEAKQYRATGSMGTYSEYYKLDLSNGGYVDVTTSKSLVFAFNFTEYADSGLPLTDHYVPVNGNQYLDPGLYLIKFTYQATSLEPGSVSFFFSDS